MCGDLGLAGGLGAVAGVAGTPGAGGAGATLGAAGSAGASGVALISLTGVIPVDSSAGYVLESGYAYEFGAYSSELDGPYGGGYGALLIVGG